MKQTTVFLLTLAMTIGLYAQDCDQVWYQFDSSTPSQTGEDMAVDAAGNVYVSASISTGSSIHKFGPDGSLQWSNSNSNFNEETQDVSLDGNGNIVVSGYHWSLTTGGNYVGDSVWIAKYTPTGSLMWRQSLSVYMFQIFSFSHLCTHAHGSNGDIYLAADNQGELLLYKFSANGNLIWTRAAGTAGVDYPTAMETSGDGRILLTGSGATGGHVYLTVYSSNGNQLWEASDFQDYDGVNDAHFASSGQVELLTSTFNVGTNRDITLLTYNSNGTLVNIKHYDTGVSEFPKSFVQSSSGEYYFSCQVTQTSGLPYTDWLTVKGDANGNVLWSDRYNATSGNDELPADIHLGADGKLYVTGTGGPQYPSPPTGLMARSMVTLKYAPNNGNRICTIIKQDESSNGIRVIAQASGDFYVLGSGARELYKYGNNITPPTCDAPAGLTASNITDNSAELSWMAVSGAQSYSVRYRPQGATAWAMESTSNTTIAINGLMAEMPYEWQVATVCSAASSPFSSTSTFTTDVDPGNGGGGGNGGSGCSGTATDDFPDNPLTTVNANINTTTFSFVSGSEDASFTISDLGEFGRDNIGYIDEVTVNFVDGNGNTVLYGVFSGDVVDEVQVDIDGPIQEVSVSLTNGQTSLIDYTLSVDLSPITYCPGIPVCPEGDSDQDGICDGDDICPAFDDNLIGAPCDDGDPCTVNDVYTVNCNCAGTYIDSDQDGVCDANDVCAGGDDNIDTDQDGVPDYCECAPNNGEFPENPLVHSGLGANSTTFDFPANSKQASFTITEMNEYQRHIISYDEKVTVSYVDQSGMTHVYGEYLGSQVSSIAVNIDGFVQSVKVSLENALTYNSPVNMSITMSTIEYCIDSNNAQFAGSPQALVKPSSNATSMVMSMMLHPNPANDQATVTFSRQPKVGSQVIVRTMLGQEIGSYLIQGANTIKLPVAKWNRNHQMVTVTLLEPEQAPISQRLMIVK